ncbi:MAG TPA: DNRLRE domain-containing protein [Chitinophagaceae bacterium]|nr:DNRLRE domain-containing protein [Chitinophagaceae bacterium]
MKITSTFLSVSLAIFICSALPAQSFNEYEIILKADSNSRSVLLSNLLEKEPGNHSPFIGTAAWTDQGRQLQCRSLLAFNYGQLPNVIRAEQIIKAQLILVPLQLNNSIDNNNQFSKFVVQRVLEQWEDSLATWSNQPVADMKDEVTKQINPKKKYKPVKIDVTDLVKNMFLYGNNGFMIRYEDPRVAAASFSHWFASAKNENEDLRPLLVITLGNPVFPYFAAKDLNPPLPLTARDRQEIMQNYIRPEPVIVTPPAEVTPPVKPKENN